MKILVLLVALYGGQLTTLQTPRIVHLRLHHNNIDPDFDGGTLQLINAPSIISLPKTPPPTKPGGRQWYVKVKNLGPKVVTITGKDSFTLPVSVGETVQIISNGAGYLWKH